MPLPAPEPGLVIHYGYLWRHEHDRGRDNARYPRPGAIIVARRTLAEQIEVLVSPLTHQPPEAGRRALPLPARLQKSLNLPERTWVIADEVNVFAWPGFDLAPNTAGEYVWGQLPEAFHRLLRDELLAAAREGRLRQTPR